MALTPQEQQHLQGLLSPEQFQNFQNFTNANPDGVQPGQPITAPPQINQPGAVTPTNQPTGGGNVPQNTGYGLGVPSTTFKGQPASFQPRNLATGGAIGLLNDPFTPAQQNILGQVQGLAGQDVTSPFVNQLGALGPQYAAQNPYGQSGVGQAGLGAFGQLGGVGQQIAGQNPFGPLAQQGLGQLGGLSDIASGFESSGFGLSPEETQALFQKNFQPVETALDARNRRSGFASLGGENVIGAQAGRIGSDIALADAQRRAQGLQTAAGIRSGIANQLFGQGQFGAGFQRQGLQSQADILGGLGQSLLGAGQQEAAFGRQQLGDISGNIQAQAGLAGFGQQQQLDQLNQLFGTTRQGELTPLDYLTAIQANQGIARTPTSGGSDNKLSDFFGTAQSLNSLFGG